MLNKAVEEFALPSTGGKTFRLSESKAKLLVIYFYPKDNTPGCTTEGFKAKMAFPFDLLSDEDEKVCTLFGVIKMKNMYGKQVRGIERSTFVLDSKRVVCREWRGVKVPGHAQEVLDFVKTV